MDVALHQGNYPDPHKPPSYCSKCKKVDTWVRDPDNDIKSESGKVLYLKYRCTECRNTTIRKAQ